MSINEYVHEKTVVKSYAEIVALIPSGASHYIVIMTLGNRTDHLAISALVNKKLKYMGILGSKAKTKKLLSTLLAEGISPEFLNGIQAPVGLPIKSQTPEEIAVNIASEIIRVKNRLL